MKTLRILVGTFVAAALLGVPACRRDESRDAAKSPIQIAVLPTARDNVSVADALRTATMPAHTPATPKIPPTTPVVETKAAPTSTPAVPAAGEVRLGTVPRGTDLLEGPSATAEVKGTFRGRTKVQVTSAQGGYSRVVAPVVNGGSVEGWVPSSAISPAEGEKVAKTSPRAPAKSATQPAGKPPATPPAKPAPSAAKAAASGNGPDDIVLQAVAGMTAKRPPTPFTHKKHYADYGVKCEECHHPVKAQGGKVPATKTCTTSGCHQANQCNNQVVPAKNRSCPFFEDAYHFNCIACHRAQSGPTKCAECHT